MQSTRTTPLLVAASLALAVGRPTSVFARQESPQPAVTAPQPAAGKGIRFNFKDAPFDMVLDVFARETGLPVIREAGAPAGTMTFISADEYTFEEAMTILNLNLHTQGVHLRRADGFLYLTTMKAAAAQPDTVFAATLPAGVTPDQIVTITIPLSRAAAADIEGKVKPLVNPAYGSITAFPTQNLIVVCETAAQAERIRNLVTEIDTREQIDSAYRLFPLKNAKATEAIEALKGLVGQRVRQVIIDQNGQQRVVEDVTVAGLNIQAEPRTNSIIAVGPETRLKVVEELIALLDAPGGMRGEASLVTFQLETITPEQAAQSVGGLFQGMRGEARPVVLPLSGVGKLAVVAPPALLAQVSALIAAIDPTAGAQPDDPPRVVSPVSKAEVVRLAHAEPSEVAELLPRLMSVRQGQVVKVAPTPDRRGLIIAGPTADVEVLAQMVRGLDAQPEVRKDIRQVRITQGDASAALARAKALHAQVSEGPRDEVSAALDPETRTITLIGGAEAVARFEGLLRTAEAGAVVRLESRSFAVKQASASVLAERVSRLARVLLSPSDGSVYAAPQFEALDELDTLVVRAEPGHFTVIEDLIRRLDEPQPGSTQMRIVRVSGEEPARLGERAMALYRTMTAGLSPGDAGSVVVEPDASLGTLLIRGDAAGMRFFSEALEQARLVVPPMRTTRYIDVQNARAGELAAEVVAMLEQADPIDPSRRIDPPSVRVLESTNSLVVTAEDAQHAMVADLVRRLDRLETGDLPPLRLLQLRASDAQAIAAMINEQYGRRPQADRASRPMEVRADAATNTLIVSAHPDLFEGVKTLVDDLNREQREGPERETVLFPLKVAKADAVAVAMDKLYPQPPVPVDRLNRPMPWLQQPKEVTVSADPSSNSLIIDAPSDRIPSLQELAAKLDRVELPPVAELRTYRIIGANLDSIASTLRGMSSQGIIQAPAQPGKPPLKVVIETEPRSSTLIVAGDDVTFARVEQMLADLGEVPVERALRIIPVINAEAAAVRDRALAIYDAQVRDIPGARPVTVTIDTSTNSLQVVADGEAMDRFTRVLEELQRQAGPAREVRMIELRSAKVTEVVQFLRELVAASESIRLQGGPDPVLEPIETTNAILVAAQPSQLPIIEALARGLDTRATAERPPLRILRLRSTDATSLAGVLQGAFAARPIEERARKPVEIQADAATNTLIVSAHPDLLPEIEAVVTSLNETQGIDDEGREIRIFPLRVARAEELAQTIDQMFPQPPVPIDPRTRQPRPDLQPPREVTVRADRGTNSLIVDAPARRLVGFEQIVRSLDQAKLADSLEVRTYRVRRADLGSLSATLRNAASSGALGTGQGRAVAPITIDAEPVSRSLIVSGPSEIFEAVETILAQVDAAPEASPTSVRIHSLSRARAERLAPILQRVLTTRLREQQAREGPGVTQDLVALLDVSADRATNSVIITAPEAVHAVAEEIIRALDRGEGSVGGTDVIRVVPLTFADADQVASALNQAMPTFDLPAGGPVTVLSARGANALLLTGMAEDLAKIEEIVGSLDARPSDENALSVQAFELKHADAGQISPMVQNLLADQQAQDPRIIAAQLRLSRGQISTRPVVRVEAEIRTNSLIVSGPAPTVELAKTIIDRLDQPAATDGRTMATFTPARGEPASLATSVLKIVNATVPAGRRPLEVIPEPRSASLVVIGSAEQVSQAVRLLAELDDRVPSLPSLDVQVLDLRHAQASAVAPAIASLLADRSRWPEALRLAERAGVSVAAPSASPDPSGNRVIVSAPSLLMPVAREVALRLDQPRADRAVEVRVFRLDAAKADSVAAALRSALMAGVGPGDPQPVVTPEPGSNCVVVAAGVAGLERASEIIASMDAPANTSGIGVRTIYLKNVRAESIATVVERVLNKESVIDYLPGWAVASYVAQSGGEVGPQVRVAPEPRLNALVVSAPQGMLELAEQIARDLDAREAGAEVVRSTRFITLANADATELAATIADVLSDDPSGAPVTVRVDRASNSLIVRGDAAQLAIVEDLASRVDRATLRAQRQMQLVPVDRSRADAGVMAQTLKRLLEEQSGIRVEVIRAEDLVRETPPPPKPSGRVPETMSLPAGLIAMVIAQAEPPAPSGAEPAASEEEPPVTIAVDPETNSLLIVASPRMAERLARLAKELESQMPPEPVRVRIVELPEGVDARGLSTVIGETVTQVGRASATNPWGFTSPVRVGLDPGANALLVWANDTDFASVRALIASLVSVGEPARMVVKVVPLRNVSGQAASQALRDLLSDSPRGVQAQRVRQRLAVSVGGEEGGAAFDPRSVRVTEDPSGTALIVAAPPEVFATIERFVAMVDQTPAREAGNIRRYALEHARATVLAGMLRPLFEGERDARRVRIVPDDRTNSILVTGSEAHHAEIERILAVVDAKTADDGLELAIIPLRSAVPSAVRRIVEEVLIGRDDARRERVKLFGEDDAGVLIVRASAEDIAHARAVVADVDTELTGLPVRTLRLERADAQAVAAAVQRFYRDRADAASRSGQRGSVRLAITGDRRSGTLVVAAADEDFETIRALAEQFDSPAATKDTQLRIIQLEHAKASDLDSTVQSLVSEMSWERTSRWRSGMNEQEEQLFASSNTRTNSIVLLGSAGAIEIMERIVKELDRPEADQARMIVRVVRVEQGDIQAIARVVREVMRSSTNTWYWWNQPSDDDVRVEVDARRGLVMLIGKQPKVEQAVTYVEELSRATGREGTAIRSITLRHAQADRAAQSLSRFFAERARALGLAQDQLTVMGSQDGNVLVVSGDEEAMRIVSDLVAVIDQPELGDDRRVEVYYLQNADAREVATTVQTMFPRSARSDDQVIVTPQPSAERLIVSAPRERLDAISDLIARLDAPPSDDERAKIVTVSLKTARAAEVSDALRTALPAGSKLKVTPLARTNSIMLTGSDESVEMALQQIARLDEQPIAAPVEFARIKLRHAIASDVAFTVRTMLRGRPRLTGDPEPAIDYTSSDNTLAVSASGDQIAAIRSMIEQLDVPPELQRRKEFVKLEYAPAETVAKALDVFYGPTAFGATSPGARNVQIVPDPATNSLLILADESEWDGIRALMKQLDDPSYDTSRQLRVIPLRYADAASVARALNEGFQAPLETRLRQEEARREQRRGAQPDPRLPYYEPPVLVDSAETPSVSAEGQTNSLVVFAGAKDLERIEKIIEQLDVPDFAKLAPVHLIPLEAGRASQVAASIRELYLGPAGPRTTNRRSVAVIGDDSCNCLIVRAEEQEFVQIKALAGSLQQHASSTVALPKVLAVRNVPAARLQQTIRATFAPAAAQLNEPLAVEVDRASNALVVASSQRLFEQIERVVRELDGALPGQPAGAAPATGGIGQSVFIIDVKNNSPEQVRQMLEQLGVTRPSSPDRPGVVSEPVTIVPLTTRPALAIVASPGDGLAITEVVRALDAEPASAEQTLRHLPLRTADATNVVATLLEILRPRDQQSGVTPAQALAEQVRRLSLRRDGLGEPDISLDLAHPIRLHADRQSNAVLVASTPANVAALSEIVRILDALPLGDAVVVRIMPLENSAAGTVKGVVDELFRRGEALRRLPGTQRQGIPSTAAGQALAGEIAVSVDERTNTLIVAGREEAVALVEVLVKQLDTDAIARWVEPEVIELKHADAVDLARTLDRVLVQGTRAVPGAEALQRQVSRLRMLRRGARLDDPDARMESDLFAPLTGLTITAEEHINAIIVVGSPANNALVRELAAMLDVEAAGADNSVRVYPLTHAAADRVASMLMNVLRERERQPGARGEDRVILAHDLRTNAIIASTSPRSFSVLEGLLRTLDAPNANPTVGLHVLPVTNADVRTLAPKIERLMRERISAATRAGDVPSPLDTFTIEPEPATNAIILAASEENLRIVRELIDALTAESAPGTGLARTDLIQLKSALASDIVADIRALYVDKEVERRGKDAVRVLANDRLNALVVTGTDADIEEIGRLAARLDATVVASIRDIKRLELNSADAIELVGILENVLAGRPVGGLRGASGRQETLLRFVKDLKDVAQDVFPQAEINGVIRDQVTLTPDLRTNSILVAAPSKMLSLIEEIVRDLDTTSKGVRTIEKFRLQNADARQMAVLLRDIFNLQQQGNRLVLIPTRMDSTTPESADPGVRLTPVPDERQALAISIDARTNTLLVSGTDEYLAEVRTLINELDAIVAEERTSRVVNIQYGKADEIARTIREYYEEQALIRRQLLGPDSAGSLASQLEQEVTVIGDVKSNKVLISASPRYIDRVQEIVAELDAAPPQVLIQVLLAEVTLDSANDWGIDIRAGAFGGDNYTFGALAAGAGVATALGVPNVTVAADDFSLMVRALEVQGRLEVLSRPQVAVNNNERAFIQVGDNIAIVQSVERLDNGNTRADVTRDDVGILLTVTPSISADGFVRMDIQPEISTVSARTTAITADFEAPIISRRTIETVVTVMDGQTVVIGGLIQTTQEKRESRVPILGSIPIIGLPFRSWQEVDVKTELLVILTPRVIPGGRAGVAHYRATTELETSNVTNSDRIRNAVNTDGGSLQDLGPEISWPRVKREIQPDMVGPEMVPHDDAEPHDGPGARESGDRPR